MGSDRQSIMLHENGKKHREAVELDLKKRRDDKLAKEKHKKDLDSVFASVNAAVGISVGSAGGGAAGSSNFGVAKKPWEQYQTNVVAAQAQAVLSSSTSSQQAVLPTIIKKEPIKVTSSSSSTAAAAAAKQKQKQPELFDPNIGHYEIEGITYLEGSIYANILEEGMPIQLWMGSTLATNDEKRDLRNYNHWKKMALVAKVVTKKKRRSAGEEDDYGECSKQEVSCHVSYLQNETDDDETIESNVPPSRIRLVLGSDPLIPGTLEEAHLALLGGEQIIQVKEEGEDKKNDSNNNNNTTTASQVVDENTGLSSWSTTTIRKVSSQYERNQEKKRKRQHEKEIAEYKEKKEKELQARKMEEAKYANAHDSALGAYDIVAASTMGESGRASRAYKGVDINKEMKVEVSDTAKSLSKGMGSVAFKKKKNVNKKKGNVRKTCADD